MTTPAPGLTDEAALRLFAQGDRGAARILTERLAPRAFSVALRVLGDRAEAEDVTQEAMMRLWRAAPAWVEGHARPSTWLYRVTLNLCLDIKRRNARRIVGLDNVAEPTDPARSAPDRLQDATRADALQQALLHVPERQRQAVVLRHIEELANPEIAEIMETSVEAVESLVSRGKRALRAALNARRAELGYVDD